MCVERNVFFIVIDKWHILQNVLRIYWKWCSVVFIYWWICDLSYQHDKRHQELCFVGFTYWWIIDISYKMYRKCTDNYVVLFSQTDRYVTYLIKGMGNYVLLITCVIARSNPRRLLAIWREKLRGHYHVIMTSDNDFCVWRWHYSERHSRISVNAQTIGRNTPRIRALITSCNDRHVWTDRNSFTGMSTEMIKSAVFFVFLSKKNTHKTHEIVKVAVINDNNNFPPSLFRSLCEIVGDCFGPRYFSSGAALPQKNTSVQNNHLRFHTMTSKKMVRSYYCLIVFTYWWLTLYLVFLNYVEIFHEKKSTNINNYLIIYWNKQNKR